MFVISRGWILATLIILLGACSNNTTNTGDSRGSLTVTITGLSVPGLVEVTGPEGFKQTLTATTTLNNLKPGTYTLTPKEVGEGNYIYAASASTVTVAGGSTAAGTAAYAAITGALTVTISNLPFRQYVSVSGPDYFLTFTATITLTLLTPASYTIDAPTVDGYSISVTGNPASVTAGSTVTASVSYIQAGGGGGGTLDTSFGTDGKVTTDIGSDSDYASSVAIQNDGKIVVAGQAGSEPNIDFALARYNNDGNLDTNFGTGGIVTDIGGRNPASSLALQSDGKIVVAGNSALARYNNDGSLDTSFGTGGTVTTDTGGTTSVVIQNDGKIVVVGYGGTEGNSDFALVRYNP